MAGCVGEVEEGPPYVAGPVVYDSWYWGGYYDGPYWVYRDRDGHWFHEARVRNTRRGSAIHTLRAATAVGGSPNIAQKADTLSIMPKADMAVAMAKKGMADKCIAHEGHGAISIPQGWQPLAGGRAKAIPPEYDRVGFRPRRGRSPVGSALADASSHRAAFPKTRPPRRTLRNTAIATLLRPHS